MESCLLLPSIGSLNLGDEIITELCIQHLKNLPSHPLSLHQYHSKHTVKRVKHLDRLIAVGTNCIPTTYFIPSRIQIKLFAPHHLVSIFSYRQKIVSYGCGMTNFKYSLSDYLLGGNYIRFFFSRQSVHSVRDEPTAHYLRTLGFQALNTSCPTTWQLPDCGIQSSLLKPSILLSVTSYRENVKRDLQWLTKVFTEFPDSDFYLLLQGPKDYDYFLKIISNAPSLKFYALPKLITSVKSLRELILDAKPIHIGTRLHCSIFFWHYAMKSILIKIDNRSEHLSQNGKFPIFDINYVDEMSMTSILDNYKRPFLFDEIRENIQYFIANAPSAGLEFKS